jgi:hypothetical protein
MSNERLDVLELPLGEFKPQPDWPEKALRPEVRPVVYFTDLPNMACVSALVVAPRDCVFGIAPISSYWKHAQSISPTPVQGGARQLEWLSKVHRSTEMASRFKSDLAIAGHADSRFRRGLLPYEGGACMGLPAVGVSEAAGPTLSAYAFRSYLLPGTDDSRSRFVDEFTNLFAGLGNWALMPTDACRLSEQDELEWSLTRQGSNPRPTLEAEAFSLVGNEQRGLGWRARTERIHALAATAAAFHTGSPHPLLADFAVRLPQRVRLPAALIRNMTALELADVTQMNEAIDELFALRARLLCELRWPTFYWAAHDGIDFGEKMFGKDAGRKPAVDPLRQLLDGLQRDHPVLTDQFLERLWRT